MRSYLDIIIDLKDGKKPDYEEVRLACLMAVNMLFFAESDVKHLMDPAKNRLVESMIKENVENRFKQKKMSPEEYLGDHHPDHQRQKERMAQSEKIWNAFQKHQNQKAKENTDGEAT